MVVVLVILQLVLVVTLIKLIRRPAVSRVLSLSLLVFAFLWYIFPLFIRLFIEADLEVIQLLSDDDYVYYGIVETTVFLISVLFLFFSKPYFRLVRNNDLTSIRPSPLFALIIVCLGIAATALFWAGAMSQGNTYLERNAFAITGEGTSQFVSGGSIGLLHTLAVSFGFASLLVKWPRGSMTRLLYLAIAALMVFATIPHLMLGARIVVLTPLVLVFLRAGAMNWPIKKTILTVGTLLVVTVIVGSALSVAVGSYRTKGDLTAGEIVSRTQAEVGLESSRLDPTMTMSGGIATKFSSIAWGGYLVETYGEGSGGLRPYEGVLVALLPRWLFDSKPIPGAADGTYWTHPTRLVVISQFVGSDNVSISPAATVIWQVGYWGLIALVLTNVVNLFFINSLLQSSSIVLHSLAFFLIGIPSYFSLFASPDLILMNLQRAIAIYVALLIVVKVAKRYVLSDPSATRFVSQSATHFQSVKTSR